MPRLPDVPTRWVLETVESDRLKGTYPALWADPQTTCIICRFEKTGSKNFRWWNTIRTDVVDWECNCVHQWILHRYMLSNGIQMKYQRLGWMDAVDVPDATIEQARDYLKRADYYVDAGMNLILWSKNTGTGKTLTLMLVAKTLMEQGHDVFVAQMTSVVEMYTSGWRSKEDKDHFERRIMNCGVLVIDDLGKELPENKLDFLDRLIDRVIRHRVAACTPTLITSNHTPEMLSSGYNRFVASLLTESCIYIETSGNDWRPNVGVRQLREAELGLRRPLVIG